MFRYKSENLNASFYNWNTQTIVKPVFGVIMSDKRTTQCVMLGRIPLALIAEQTNDITKVCP